MLFIKQQANEFKKEETVVIGDQLLTDVLGGNSRWISYDFSRTSAQTDGFATKFNRMVERRIIKLV